MTEIEMRFYHLACSFFANNTKQETKEIDWEQAGIPEEEARKVHAVREFPAGVGRKRQETL